MKIPKATLFKWMGFWPPFFGAGIRVRDIAPDFSRLRVEMPLTRMNRNYVGTQFGGSLYAMVDPFYMLMLMEQLGRDYIVWDKAALIQFKSPGRGKVHAVFELTPERVADIRAAADRERKVEPIFNVEILSESGEIVATVAKTLYVRKKDPIRE